MVFHRALVLYFMSEVDVTTVISIPCFMREEAKSYERVPPDSSGNLKY